MQNTTCVRTPTQLKETEREERHINLKKLLLIAAYIVAIITAITIGLTTNNQIITTTNTITSILGIFAPLAGIISIASHASQEDE